DSNPSVAGLYDIRAIRNNGSTLPCYVTNCSFPLGVEVQILDVYSGDTNPLVGGEYRLQYLAEGSNNISTSSCIAYNANFSDVRQAVENIIKSSVSVSRESISDPGYGYRYWITFIGAGVRGNVSSLTPTDFVG
ncbi:unnamed protein product, partial [Choristocarpus tenellus]